MATVAASAIRRIDRWLEYVFYSGVELSALSTPALTFLLFGAPFSRDGVSIGGLVAVAMGTFALAVFRGNYVDVGEFPAIGGLTNLPFRIAYYNLLLGSVVTLGAYGWAQGAPLLSVLVPASGMLLGMAVLPRVYGLVR